LKLDKLKDLIKSRIAMKSEEKSKDDSEEVSDDNSDNRHEMLLSRLLELGIDSAIAGIGNSQESINVTIDVPEISKIVSKGELDKDGLYLFSEMFDWMHDWEFLSSALDTENLIMVDNSANY